MNNKLLKPNQLVIIIIVISLSLAIALLSQIGTGLKQAPQLTLKLIDGKKIKLSSLRGRPVIINFWASNCSICLREMPQLVKLYNDMSSQGLEMIGISMPYDMPSRVVMISKQFELNYAIALDSLGEATRAFGNVNKTPTTFLIGLDGKIEAHMIGEVDTEFLKQKITLLLSNKTKQISLK